MRTDPTPFSFSHRYLGGRILFAVLAVILGPGLRAADEPRPESGAMEDPGQRVYVKECASCHGKVGEGVDDEYDKALAGDKSVQQLARYIEKRMPDEAPKRVTGEDALNVARYIHGAFYSPIARARNRKPRIELSRLTVRQYRHSVADLVGSFRSGSPRGQERGLRGEYYNSRRLGGSATLRRLDPSVRFDFGKSSPEKLDFEGFSARWSGSVLAPETGDYEFVVRTDHAARLWVNHIEEPLIDAWVKSGDDTEYRASIFLIDGRAYPIRLEFTSRRQGVNKEAKKREKPIEAFVELLWMQPRRVEEVIPTRFLSPERVREEFVVATPFPPDDRSIGYERGTAISRAWDDAATGGAIETAGHVVEHLQKLSGVGRDEEDREGKLREFCTRFVERAFRRPITDVEKRLFVDRQFARAPNLEAAVKRVALLVLKSPRFLYVDPGGKSKDPYAVASRLSFALWDSLPDEALLEAAAAGELATREQVARQTERMLRDARTRSKVRQFLHYWLQMEHARDLAKDLRVFPGFDAAMASDLRTSLDLFLDDVLWGDDADFRRLLLSNELYLNGRLARYYGYDLPAEAPFQKVSAREVDRVGVLSHPYLMASFAYMDATSPIHRGVFLSRSVLGRSLRPPPEAVAPLAPDLHPDLTTRERVTLQTKPQACQGCHGMINPLGFALERFDAVGRYRLADRGRPIDTSGAYEMPSGEERRFEGARDLAEFLAASGETHRAFLVQLFHHLVKQPMLAYGPETPAALLETFAAQEFDVRKLVAEIVTMAALRVPALDFARTKRYDDRGGKSVRLRRF